MSWHQLSQADDAVFENLSTWSFIFLFLLYRDFIYISSSYMSSSICKNIN